MKRISFAHSRETQLLACQDEYEQISGEDPHQRLEHLVYTSPAPTPRHAAKVIHLITFCERRTQYPMLPAQP